VPIASIVETFLKKSIASQRYEEAGCKSRSKLAREAGIFGKTLDVKCILTLNKMF